MPSPIARSKTWRTLRPPLLFSPISRNPGLMEWPSFFIDPAFSSEALNALVL
jgi:hypothetical protein